MKKINSKKGFLALLTVIMLLVTFSSLSLVALTLSTKSSRLTTEKFFSVKAQMLGESCAEEGLFQVRNDVAYAGGEEVFPQGSCDVTVDWDGSTVTVRTVSEIGDFTKTFEVKAVRESDHLRLLSWQEK